MSGRPMSNHPDSHEARNENDGYNPKHVNGKGFNAGSRSGEPLWPEPPRPSDRNRPRQESDEDGQILFPSRKLGHEGNEAEHFEREPLVGYEFRGPVPPPDLIDRYDRLSPGAGQRILDDAHENEVLDRYVTKKAFDTAVLLEVSGFIAAIVIVVLCFSLAAVSIFVFENNGGGVIFGLSAATPIVLGFLGNRGGSSKSSKKRTEDES